MSKHHAHAHHHHRHDIRHRVSHLLRPHSHDPAQAIDDALTATLEGVRAVRISLLVLGIGALIQLALVLVTGSVALLADTVHNFADALTAIPLWITFVLGRRAASDRYTFGFGRAEDLAGAFVVLMVAGSAVLAGVESIRRLLDPQPLSYPWVVVAAGLVGAAANEIVAVYRIRVGRRIGSAALVADGVHARTDGLTSLAVVVGAIGVMAGFPLADPIIGLAITIAILSILRGAARSIWHRLMDAVDPDITDQVRELAAATPAVLAVQEVRVRWNGHVLTAQVQVAVSPTLTAAETDAVADAVDQRLRADVRHLQDAHVATRVAAPA